LRIAVISSFIASITASEEEGEDDDDDDDVFVFSASDNDEGGEEEASVAFRVKSLKSLPPSPVHEEGDENDAFARYDSASKKEDEDEEAIVSLSL
jgi:hypothetical protein